MMSQSVGRDKFVLDRPEVPQLEHYYYGSDTRARARVRSHRERLPIINISG